MEIIDILILCGAGYVFLKLSGSPVADAVEDIVDTATTAINANVSSIDLFFKGDFQGSFEASCDAPLAYLRPDCAIYSAQKDSYNVGSGTAQVLHGCPSGFQDGGLLCTNWSTLQTTEKKFGCPDGKQNVDGLCYAPCPSSHPNRVAGMPYLCKA